MLNSTSQFYYERFKEVQQLSYVNHRLNVSRSRSEMRIKAQEYDDGIHNTQLTERIRAFLNINTEQGEFNVNYCPLIVNAKADRLKVTGLQVEDKTQKELLWKWWRKNRMDAKQNIIMRSAILNGDAYVLVEWDSVANIPRFHYEPAYTGYGVECHYSDERRDEVEFASKQWQINTGQDTGKMGRVNLYFPDRIEKYYRHDDTENGIWMPYEDEDTNIVAQGRMGMAGIIWWTTTRTEGGDPLGIPIVHFKNNDKGEGYGTSELADVFSAQDIINKSMIDLIAAMDANGFPVFVGYGFNWTSLQVGPGAIASVTKDSPAAKLESIPAMSPTGLLEMYNTAVMEAARISGTPMSYFQASGQVAAEGTMKQQEVALVSKVKKTQTDFGNCIEDMFTIARRLHNTFSTEAPLDEDEIIDTVWEMAESRNDMEQAQTLSIKVQALGVSEEQAQTELGYDETQIAAFKRAKIKAQADAIRNKAKMGMNPQAGQQNMTQTENENNDNATRTQAAA